MESQAKQAAQGWLDSIKHSLTNFFNTFEFTWAKATEYGIALAVGIFTGFVVHRYGKQTIVLIILFGFLLFGLDHFGFIAIDWTKVKEFFGVAPAGTAEAFFQEYVRWAKEHLIAVVVALVGFIIGYKIGC